MPLKILYLLDFLRTIQAGTEGQLAHLLRALPSRSCQVKLVSIQDSPYLASNAQADFPEVSFHVLHGSSDLSRSLPAFSRLLQYLRREKPDLVHVIFPAANTLGVLVSRLAGVRTIIGSRRDMGYAYNSKDMMLLRLANNFVARIIVNARGIRERTIEKEGVKPGKIAVIYNGLNFDKTDPPVERSREGKTVAIVANLNRDIKRIDVFLRAAAMTVAIVPQATFLVIGDGHLRPNLERLTADLGIREHVKFLGRRTNVKEILSGVDLGVLSSDSEGLSNAILEYMACGLPVVATAVGGNPELVKDGETGLLVSPGNPEAMASAMAKILRDTALASNMGHQGRERVIREFNVERMVTETLNVYSSALTGQNSTHGKSPHGH